MEPPPELDQKIVIDALTEFTSRLDEVYGLYLDATQGFRGNSELIARLQSEARHLVPDPAKQDELPFIVGRGDPNDKASVVLHQTTQGRFKQRNVEAGPNDRLLAQYFVVLVFHLWEHEYRPRIAKVLGVSGPEDLELDIFGDVRLIRNEILKNKARLSRQTTRRLRILTDLSEGQIFLSASAVENIVRQIKASCDVLSQKAVGVDPKLRTIFRVR